ncbi:hypothetical protein ILUMI_26106 [Ignelater luminosus]|uniref:Uncharacterized protein n=1 Tax=Ignelater luminosus TaxID=2038154 RepID=A0A8K0C437_IGNLU|nr:hypothetical protein ILUMI_26106 [Ignelater luminosus]
MTAVYLGNRTLGNTAEKKTAYELFFAKRPNVRNLKLYRFEIYVGIPEAERTSKLNPKVEKEIPAISQTREDTKNTQVKEAVEGAQGTSPDESETLTFHNNTQDTSATPSRNRRILRLS